MSKSSLSAATSSSRVKKSAKSPKRASPVAAEALLPTPPKSGKASVSVSKRSSPRSQGSHPNTSPLIPAIPASVKTTSTPPAKNAGAAKKKSAPLSSPVKPKKGASVPSGFDEGVDMLCPICDDICTCIGVVESGAAWASVASGTSSALASPILATARSGSVIRNAAEKKKCTKNAVKKSQPANTISSKKSSNGHKKDRLDHKIDQAAQYLISDFYFRFPEDYYDDDDYGEYDQSYAEEDEGREDCSDYGDGEFDSDSSLDALMFEISSDESGQEAELLLINKVNSVIGPSAWLRPTEMEETSPDDEDGEDEGAAFYIFDPVDAANLVVNLPIQLEQQESSQQQQQQPTASNQQMSDLTPQVLAAISAATKTLAAASQHYSQNPDLPFSREASKQVQFVLSPPPPPPPSTSDMVPLEELLDTSCLHGSSPPQQPSSLLKRWERIPINAYRKRRLSVPKVLATQNAFKTPVPEDLAVCQPLPDASFEALSRRSSAMTTLYEGLPKRTQSVVQGLADEIEDLSLDPKMTTSSQQLTANADVFDGVPAWFTGDDSYLLGEHWRSLSIDIDLDP